MSERILGWRLDPGDRAALLAQMPPWQGGGEMVRSVTWNDAVYDDPPYRFEAGTPPIAGAVGLAAAFD